MELTLSNNAIGERALDVPADVQGRASVMLRKLRCKVDKTAFQLKEELSSPEREWMMSYHMYQLDRLSDKLNAQGLVRLKELRANIEPTLTTQQLQLWKEFHLLVDQMEAYNSMLDRCNMVAHT